MDTIDKVIEKTTHKDRKQRNWDFYRNAYLRGDMTFMEIKRINDIWYPLFQNQEFHTTEQIVKGFNMVGPAHRHTVLELGCYRGALAESILQQVPDIDAWFGYDICDAALDECLSHPKFGPIRMDDWFHKLDNIPSHDIFVSTHTLEHMSNDEAIASLEKAIESPRCRYVMLEMPIPEAGKIWRGGGSSHVLSLGRKHFRKFFDQRGWTNMHEYTRHINWGVMYGRSL